MRLASKEIVLLSKDSEDGFSIVISTLRLILNKKDSQAIEDLSEYRNYFD